MGILDTVAGTEFAAALQAFNPQGLVLKHLEKLEARDAQVLSARYGLLDGVPQTLERVGERLGLTRERIRQIEKDALKKSKHMPLSRELEGAVDLVFRVIEDHGKIIRETDLLKALLPADGEIQKKSVLFLLHLLDQFRELDESAATHKCWYLFGFDEETLEAATSKASEILGQAKKTLPGTELFMQIREHSTSDAVKAASDEAIESMVSASKHVAKNPYAEWGIVEWSEIRPRDVGDKAYLVLKHHAKPEHYAKINEMINKQGFDGKTAHKETVHNELIKDKRFVLVGRGIYALTEWGYRPGVVADIIEEILRKTPRPLTRDEIIEEVLTQRLVKKNTIIVGLANKKRFRKTPDNHYTNV